MNTTRNRYFREMWFTRESSSKKIEPKAGEWCETMSQSPSSSLSLPRLARSTLPVHSSGLRHCLARALGRSWESNSQFSLLFPPRPSGFFFLLLFKHKEHDPVQHMVKVWLVTPRRLFHGLVKLVWHPESFCRVFCWSRVLMATDMGSEGWLNVAQ